METLKGVLIAGAPVITIALGFIIMAIFGYRGYGMDIHSWGQWVGATLAAIGVAWFVIVLLFKLIPHKK